MVVHEAVGLKSYVIGRPQSGKLIHPLLLRESTHFLFATSPVHVKLHPALRSICIAHDCLHVLGDIG